MAYPLLTHVDRARRAERVAKRYAQGVSASQVADEFGLSRSRVSEIARLYEVSRPAGRPRSLGQLP